VLAKWHPLGESNPCLHRERVRNRTAAHSGAQLEGAESFGNCACLSLTVRRRLSTYLPYAVPYDPDFTLKPRQVPSIGGVRHVRQGDRHGAHRPQPEDRHPLRQNKACPEARAVLDASSTRMLARLSQGRHRRHLDCQAVRFRRQPGPHLPCHRACRRCARPRWRDRPVLRAGSGKGARLVQNRSAPGERKDARRGRSLHRGRRTR